MTQEASLGEEAEEGRRVGGQASSAPQSLCFLIFAINFVPLRI